MCAGRRKNMKTGMTHKYLAKENDLRKTILMRKT